MDKDIEYVWEQEKRKIENKLRQLTWLGKRLNITDRDKLKEILEFAALFNECNENGWIKLK